MLFFSAFSGSLALCPTSQNADVPQEVDTFTQMMNNAYFQNKIPFLFSAPDFLPNLTTGNVLLSCRLEENPFHWLKIMGLGFFSCFVSA